MEVLKSGVAQYPEAYQLHAKLVHIAMSEKDWKLASQEWQAIYNIKGGKIKAVAYASYGKSLRFNKEYSSSSAILFEGLKKFPKKSLIILELSKTLIKQKEWQSAAELWDKLFSVKHNKLPVNAYLEASLTYQRVSTIEKSEVIIRKGIEVYPRNKRLINEYAEIAIRGKKWASAIQRLEDHYIHNHLDMSFNMTIKFSMLHQMIGSNQKAKEIFQSALDKDPKKVREDSRGYRKLIIFDNGESRIEFHKKLHKTDKVIVTFDSINMVWGNPSFAYKLLSRENLDIIAVRKRRKKTYQQDLSQEDFVKAVRPLVEDYKDKIAYGFSLGAYATLYYASIINCRILAISPRLSIHPLYGRRAIISKFDFNHNISHAYNPKLSPIIVYDPKNHIDHTYIQKEIIQSFPNAEIVKVPYGGHAMAPHLLKMGVLKDFILAAISNKVPKYNRKYKSKSSTYFRQLGSECLRRNKLMWAMDLAERSIEMLPTDKLGIKLKVNVLTKLERYEEAIDYLQETIRTYPNLLDARIHLIDIYISVADWVNAKRVTEQAIEKFGERKTLSEKTQVILER